MQTSFTHSSSK